MNTPINQTKLKIEPEHTKETQKENIYFSITLILLYLPDSLMHTITVLYFINRLFNMEYLYFITCFYYGSMILYIFYKKLKNKSKNIWKITKEGYVLFFNILTFLSVLLFIVINILHQTKLIYLIIKLVFINQTKKVNFWWLFLTYCVFSMTGCFLQLCFKFFYALYFSVKNTKKIESYGLKNSDLFMILFIFSFFFSWGMYNRMVFLAYIGIIVLLTIFIPTLIIIKIKGFDSFLKDLYVYNIAKLIFYNMILLIYIIENNAFGFDLNIQPGLNLFNNLLINSTLAIH